jgi:pilus assembly protein CpaC
MWGPAIPEFAPGQAGLSQANIQDKGLFFQSLSGNFLFNLVIDAAKDKGLAKVLAEPNLTTMSGQEAKFLAGGEFPIPVPQDFGRTTIEYKEFGVGLVFVPVVLDSGVISLKVNVVVSDLTNQNSLTLPTAATGANFFVPAITKRSANSTVEVQTGQTIAIAGLINESLRETVNKFPGLGEIPVLGMLFRSQEYVKGQTELMIFVTPRLARSFDPQLVKLPTDSFVEPTDLEFYLMGRTEGRKNRGDQGYSTGGALGPDKSGSEGPFGHDL